MRLSFSLPLLVQCDKVSRVGSQESVPMLGGIVQMVGVMLTLRAGAARCDHCIARLGEQTFQQGIIGAVIQVNRRLAGHSQSPA